MGIAGRKLLVGAGVGVLALVSSACSSQVPITTAELTPKTESTKVFAADGALITTLKQEENREIVRLDQIPSVMKNAAIAIEDSRFYIHRGIDAKAILRASVANASSGKVVEGGSTITQQLVRNALTDVGKSQTVERKLKEAVYAFRIDGKYPKDKILELYLNTVYFGEGAYGVETAAKTYFDKDVKDLTLPEAALIAGLIRSPLRYDPWTNPDNAVIRRNRVIDRMVVSRFISKAEADAAKSTPLRVRAKPAQERYLAPYFIDYITRQIQRSPEFAVFGATEQARGDALYRRGLRIYTTLDMKMQKAAEDSISKILDRPNDPSAALVSLDPKNGYLRALVGGKDYFATQADDPCVKLGAINLDGSPKSCAKVNLALGQAGGGSGRQGGSSFKPFVLATALQTGMRDTDYYSAPSCIDIPNADAGGTKPWHVCNYEEKGFGGGVSVREATYRSINTAYAQIIDDIGTRRPEKDKNVRPAESGGRQVAATAERMGLCMTTRPLLPKGDQCRLAGVPSAALGANSVSPLDMAAAFTAFANAGARPRPVSITKITDSQGKLLWKATEKTEQVLPAGIAYLTNNVLQDVIAKGTAAATGQIDRPAFGKTGTSQEFRDAWFVGGAGTDLLTAVSVFWPDGEIEMKTSCYGRETGYQVTQAKSGPTLIPPECRATRIRVSGATWPTEIWHEFMISALDGTPPSDFPPSPQMITVDVDEATGCLPGPDTPPGGTVSRRFPMGAEPTEPCQAPVRRFIRETPKPPQPSPSAPGLDELQPGLLPGLEGAASARDALRALKSQGYRVVPTYEDGCQPSSTDCSVSSQSTPRRHKNSDISSDVPVIIGRP